MADQTLASLTAATPASGGLFYGTQGGADRKFTLSAHGAALAEGTGLAALLAAPNIFTAAGAASTPALSVTGAPFTGGTGTTTKPLFSVETAGATSTAWNTAGTMLGVNAPSGFNGDTLALFSNGTKFFNFYYDQASGTTIFGPPTNGFSFYNNTFYPYPVNSLALGRPGVSDWLGLSLTSAAIIQWNVDAGIARVGAAALKVTDASAGYGSIDAGAYKVGGASGIDFSGAVTNITVVKGIVTAAS